MAKLKFGSPAWRAKYMKKKTAKRKGPVRSNPTIRVKLGRSLEAAQKRAQKMANRTGKTVEIHFQRRSTEGRGDKNYWAYYDTIGPDSNVRENPPSSWTKVKAFRVVSKGGRKVLEVRK